MNPLLLAAALAVLWLVITGSLSPGNLILGAGAGLLVAFFGQTPEAPRPALRWPRRLAVRLLRLAAFVPFYLWEVVKSNVVLALDVLSPRLRARPAIVALPLDLETPGSITLLANLITMTPGTLSLDVSDDRRVLYVHAMYVQDLDAVRRGLKVGLERRVAGLGAPKAPTPPRREGAAP